MNISDCPRIDDAGAYVLRAMEESEWQAHRYHIAECEFCAAKVAELEFVARALLSGVPQLAAPPHMRDRVMSVVRSEAELLTAAGAGADRPKAPRFARRLHWPSLRALPAAALASVALALGLGAGTLLSGSDEGASTRTVSAQVDETTAPGAKAEMRMTSGDARLLVDGMPAPADGRIYQVWLDHGGDQRPPLPTDALFSTNRDGKATVQVPGDLKDVTAVLVTSEPRGGSEIPTRQPVITARV
ncbi:MAG: anti-sigma factor [Actinomycetota bacterium]|nr:anti-sigma factor [Actinomycetota bacterium]